MAAVCSGAENAGLDDAEKDKDWHTESLNSARKACYVRGFTMRKLLSVDRTCLDTVMASLLRRCWAGEDG